MTHAYKGESTVLPLVMGRFCTSCGESILDTTESRRTMNLMLAFHKQVDASM